MCLVVYLASDKPLRLIEWNSSEGVPPPPLYIEEVGASSDDPEKPASLTLPYRYYAGSCQGCGCGFNVHDSDAEEKKEFDARESRQALASHIREAIDAGATVELHAFWCDEGEKAPIRSARGTPEELILERDIFEEGEFLVFEPAPRKRSPDELARLPGVGSASACDRMA